VLKILDTYFFYLINKGFSNKLFDILMPLLSRLGRWESLFAVSLVFAVFQRKTAMKLVIILLIGFFASNFIVSNLKMFVARPRPFFVLQNINLLEKNNSFSFPSGHATNAFMVATIFFIFSRRYFYLYIAAFGIAVSRIYLGAHFPSDAIAGALIGSALGYLITQAAKAFSFRVHKHPL